MQGLDAGMVADIIGAFVTGERRRPPGDRDLVTLLFTDVVDSTPTAAAAGDAAWRSVLDGFDRRVSAMVDRHHGSLVKHTGDGALATFPSVTAALRAARELRDATGDLGLAVRTGVHLGEVDRRGADIGGLAVHLAARVMGAADAGQILASSTAVQAALGGRHTFRSVGSTNLKGFDQPWELFARDDPAHRP